jgi:multidrug efflux pump subunit AcrA (membrane-fusion protein)
MVRLGAEDCEVEIHAVDTVCLAIPVPGEKRALVQPGSMVRFIGDDADGSAFAGEIVAIDTEIVVVNGQAMVWASAEIDNHSRSLTPGMTGVAEILADGESPSLLATLTSLLRGDP